MKRRGTLFLLFPASSLIAGCLLPGSGRPAAPPSPGGLKPAASTKVSGRVRFTDVTTEAGVDFVQSTGGCGQQYFVEQVAAGAAVFDADGDGNLDLYFPQPKPLGICKFSQQLHQRLYLGDGKGHFRLSPDAFGKSESGYGIGASTADYDNDGDLDLFVTCFGKSALYQNDGKGHFVDVTGRAGLGHMGFATSSAWLDYDRDGYLDLYVANYAHYLLTENVACFGPHGQRDVCTPLTYPPAPNVLYHNNRDGTFTEVTVKAGALAADGRSLGVATMDFDGDGWQDIFVANDLSANALLLNQHDGTFKDAASQRGVALGGNGKAQANMGVAVGDADRDGNPDFVVTVFSNEPFPYYHNRGGYYTDESVASGLARATLLPLAFGTCFFDADNDGLLDLFFAEGHVSPFIKEKFSNMTYAQHNQLMLGDGKGTFIDASDALPGDDVRVHRGVAYGDFDHDGDLDLIVTANDGRPSLLRNDSPPANYLDLRLIDARGNPSPIGARCTITAGGQPQTAWVIGGGSYASQSDYTLHFGLGKAAAVGKVSILWPSGRKQEMNDIPAGKTITVREGKLPAARP